MLSAGKDGDLGRFSWKEDAMPRALVMLVLVRKKEMFVGIEFRQGPAALRSILLRILFDPSQTLADSRSTAPF
jgi:hypothetical protein